MQKIPRPGESFVYEKHRFTVEDVEAHRIAKVKIEEVPEAVLGQAGD
jgi:CBS domain containing-hemolysin-like protein